MIKALAILVAAGLTTAVSCGESGDVADTPVSTQTATATAESTPTTDPISPVETPETSATPGVTATATSTAPIITPEPLEPLELERVFSWYSPARPTHMLQANDGSGRIFVSEQSGRLIELTGEPTSSDGTQRTVLDVRSKVTGRGNEEGFLGFALHPQFAENNRLFVYYSSLDPRRSIISEFLLQEDGFVDPESEHIIMEVPQPQTNHNGGMLAFGPDGYLYISLGDGGGSGDRDDNAQDTSVILGSILRIDVGERGDDYTVPDDNPFAGQGGAPEIWAYGLRNPWRFSFDQLTGEMWAGDVGQNEIEEVNLIEKGQNYGWRLKEGPDCFNPSSDCDRPGLVEPVISYTHDFGCSVSGGYVYRGARMPSLYGAYVYADFCSGIIWALRREDGSVQEEITLIDTNTQIPAFGQTLDGEVYILTYVPGIFRFIDE